MTDVDLGELEEIQTENERVRRAKQAIAGPVPLIADAPDCKVHLQRGLKVLGGEYETEALVRELTGEDEEALARLKEFTDFFDGVLARGVVRIGNLDLSELPTGERQARLLTVLIGEREQLFLGILIATYGDEKKLNFTCGTCRSEQVLTLSLHDDLKVTEVEELKERYEFTTTKGQKVEYRLAIGADQMEALQRKGSTTAEQNTIVLSRCITKVDGQTVVDPVVFARRMSMKDRALLLSDLITKQPSVDLTVKVPCASCEAEQNIPLGWADLFQA